MGGHAALQAVKLAIIRQRYDPYGGAERFVTRAVEALREQDAQCTVIARDWLGEPADAAWQRCDPFYLGRIWRDRGFAQAACAAVSNGSYDLIQSHERIDCCDVYRAGDGVHAQWLEHRAKTLNPLERLWLRLSLFHRHLLAAERRLFRSTRLRAVICNSKMVRDEIARRFPVAKDKLHVIYNGVDLETFHPSLASRYRAVIRQRLGIPEAATVLLFVGAGFERKGLRVLLDSLHRLNQASLHLIVVGKDRNARKLEDYSHELGLAARTHWVGPQLDVPPWYGAADVFVLPTLYDPFPNASLEALASGLPVVTTSHCGAAEIIRDGWNGLVCQDPLSVDELVGSLRKAIAFPLEARINARQSVESFGLPEMAQALVLLYRKLLAPVVATG